MPQINLLPWREELRKEREKSFGIAVGVAVALAAGMVFYAMYFYDQLIAFQESRNAYLEQQIEILDKQIAEIQQLEETKQRLIARMQVIEELQAARPRIVHVFEELVLTLPEGVFLTSVTQSGDQLTLEGTAQSPARVSALMRNINDSEWLGEPELDVIQTQERGDERTRNFSLKAKTISPKSEEDEDSEEGGE